MPRCRVFLLFEKKSPGWQRKVIAEKTDADSEVTIYAGATGGLVFQPFTALIHPGDEVIMFRSGVRQL